MRLLTIVFAALLGAALVRLAPGFGVDERELDPRLRSESIQSIRHESTPWYESRTFHRPIQELFAQRLPVTLRSVAIGLAGGWLLALGFACSAIYFRHPAVDMFATLLSGTTLALPSAVVALLFLLAGWPPGVALAVVVFPRVFRYLRNLFADVVARPHVLLAEAKGVSRLRILAMHVLPVAAPQMLALAGVSVNIAFGAAIPIEVVCDSPGIGHLALQAALGRDLPLLVCITVFVTMVTVAANSVGDLAT